MPWPRTLSAFRSVDRFVAEVARSLVNASPCYGSRAHWRLLPSASHDGFRAPNLSRDLPKHYPPRALSERLIPLTSLLLHNHLETECI
jgi:hypothetical protein